MVVVSADPIPFGGTRASTSEFPNPQRTTVTDRVDDLPELIGRSRSRLAGMDDRDVVILCQTVVEGLAEWRQPILQQQ